VSLNNPGRKAARERERYRERLAAGLCGRCGKIPHEPDRTSCRRCLGASNAKAKRFFRDVTGQYREAVLDHYGRECACCGESEPMFLTVDHVNNDGNEHRREVVPSQLTTWIVKNNFPPGFQILCWNCNCGKHRNGGVCPHQQRRDDR
jgi:hypothetical protein